MTINGFMELILLLTVISLPVLLGLAMWEIRGGERRRERLFCPVRLRRVRVLFRLWPDGEPADVIRCSVFGRKPVTCGKACLDRASA